MCRVEFFKIGKRDVTFIREMRVHNDAFFTIEITNLPGILPQSPKKCAIWRKLIFFFVEFRFTILIFDTYLVDF